jgi:putative phosphoribosyl transferase
MLNNQFVAAKETQHQFRNRADAAVDVALGLSIYSMSSSVVVLGLARGGVPIARHVADALGGAFGVLTSSTRASVARESSNRQRAVCGMPTAVDDSTSWYIGIARPTAGPVDTGWAELDQHAHTHRVTRQLPDLRDHTVILVDDGIATGSTMCAAVRAVRRNSPAAVIAAVPVATRFGAAKVKREVDDFYSVLTPERFDGIASFYASYPAVSDDDVLRFLGSPGSVVYKSTTATGWRPLSG